MKHYVEDLPEWMILLFDELAKEAHRELREESEAYRYFNELSHKIQEKYRICALVLEYGKIENGYKFSRKELQKLADLVKCQEEMGYMQMQKIYWKAWRDCMICMGMAGSIPAWEAYHEEKIPTIFRK